MDIMLVRNLITSITTFNRPVKKGFKLFNFFYYFEFNYLNNIFQKNLN